MLSQDQEFKNQLQRVQGILDRAVKSQGLIWNVETGKTNWKMGSKNEDWVKMSKFINNLGQKSSRGSAKKFQGAGPGLECRNGRVTKSRKMP